MATRIRLRRTGRRHQPSYRIVVAEKAAPRDGRFIETLGHYNPRTEPETLVVDRDRALNWLSQGATPSYTVRSLLKRAGVFGPVAAAPAAPAPKAKPAAAPAAGKADAEADADAGSDPDAGSDAAPADDETKEE